MKSKADTHIHTTFSDGFMSPEEIVQFVATQTDLRVVAITDHDTTEGAFVARAYAERYTPSLEVIIGQEVSTSDGDVVGLFLNSTLPRFKRADQAIAAIHAQGGLAVAVHPFSRWSSLRFMSGLGTKISQLSLDAVEARNGFPTNLVSNPLTTCFNRWLGQKLPELGGSDSHVSYTVGQAFTWFPGQTAADLRQAIEQGRVQVGGPLWTPANLIRLAPILLRHGLPHYQPVYSD